MESRETHRERFEREALPLMSQLRGTAWRLTRDRERAEDVVQETMLSAWRAFDQFRAGTNCKAWLFRIMLNLLSKQRQKSRSRPETISFEENGDRHEVAPLAQPPRFSHEEIVSALDCLLSRYRTVLILNLLEGFTCQEIADLEAIPIGTVMSRLSRGRTELRRLLRSHGERSAPVKN